MGSSLTGRWRVVAWTTIAVALALLTVAGLIALSTRDELAHQDPGTDSLAGLGYVIALGLAAPSAASLLLAGAGLGVARRWPVAARLLLGLGAVPVALLGLMLLVEGIRP